MVAHRAKPDPDGSLIPSLPRSPAPRGAHPAGRARARAGGAPLVLDCAACPDRTEAGECDGCLVAYLLDRPEGAVVFNAAEERAIRALQSGGLLPAKEGDALTG